MVPSKFVGLCQANGSTVSGANQNALQNAYINGGGNASVSGGLYGWDVSVLACLDDTSAATNSIDAAYPTAHVDAHFTRNNDGDLIRADGIVVKDNLENLSRSRNNCGGLGIDANDCATFCADCLSGGDIDKCLDALAGASSAHFHQGNPQALVELANRLGLKSTRNGSEGSKLYSGETIKVQSLGDWLVSLEGKWTPNQINKAKNNNNIMAYVSQLISFLNNNNAILNKSHKQSILRGNVATALNIPVSIRTRKQTASLAGIAEHLSMLPSNNISVSKAI